MKALIFTEGGKKIGFGHLTRCLSLYNEFIKNGIETLLIVAGDNSVLDLLKGKKFKIVNQLSEEVFTDRSINFNFIDIIVIDSYSATLHFYNTCEKNTKLCVYIDDYFRLDYPKGILINNDINTKEFHYSQTIDRSFLLGSKYTLLPSEFESVSKKIINKNIQKILITFGGTDLRNLTLPIMQLFAIHYPKIIKKVIIAPGYSNIDQIYKNTPENTDLIFNPDMKKIKQLMIDADIAISAGGQTIYELACTGTPTIVIGVAKNQLSAIKAFKKSKYIIYAGWWNSNQLLTKIVECIEYSKSFEVRTKRSKKGMLLIDNRGAKRVVNFLLNKIKSDTLIKS